MNPAALNRAIDFPNPPTRDREGRTSLWHQRSQADETGHALDTADCVDQSLVSQAGRCDTPEGSWRRTVWTA